MFNALPTVASDSPARYRVAARFSCTQLGVVHPPGNPEPFKMVGHSPMMDTELLSEFFR
jgi:hypothetical protein